MLVEIYPITARNMLRVNIYKGKREWSYRVDFVCYANLCRSVKDYEDVVVQYLEVKEVKLVNHKAKDGVKLILNITLIGE